MIVFLSCVFVVFLGDPNIYQPYPILPRSSQSFQIFPNHSNIFGLIPLWSSLMTVGYCWLALNGLDIPNISKLCQTLPNWRHPNASNRTWKMILDAAPSFFNAEFPTRVRPVWGNLVYKYINDIKAQLLRGSPVRSLWSRFIVQMCELPMMAQ